MSMGILDILAFLGSGQLNADGERITKWIDLDPGIKFLLIGQMIGIAVSIPGIILFLLVTLDL